MMLQNSMNYRNISAFNLENDNITNFNGIFLMVGQEEEVATIKRRFHTSTEKHHPH